MHAEDDGTLGVIWIAHDPISSRATVYDAVTFRHEIPLIIHDAIAARGRRFPVAWCQKDEKLSKEMLDGGVNMLPESVPWDSATRHLRRNGVLQLLKQHRLQVDSRLGSWVKEQQRWPADGLGFEHGFPLMHATAHAVKMIEYAQPSADVAMQHRKNYPELAIV